ncbi:MAG TPA: ATP-binding protein, partial [Longimicrobiales bacterium]|nr:ATP-binding protein [Longimicrobiales bacterium]
SLSRYILEGASRLGTSSHPLRVLLIEDNPGDARLIREALGEAKGLVVELEAAGTLSEGLESLTRRVTDLILLDLGLPDAQGLEGLHAIHAAARQIPVVVLTGLNDENVALTALRNGAQDYIEKHEIGGALLARAIRYAIERSRLHEVEVFISGAAQLLGSSLRLEETLAQLADLSVANLADYCAVDLLDADGRLERLLVAHHDPEQREAAEQLRKIELDRRRPHLAHDAAERRKPVLVEEVTDEHLAFLVQGEEHARVLSELRMRSYMALPLLADELLLGVLVLISASRHFTPADLQLSLRFADMAAAAIHNASLYEQASDALRTRDRVLGVVAHDLRNPLSTITMSAELLLEVDLDELQHHKQLEIIRRSADRMNRLIEDLLDVARIEHGQLTLERSYHHPEAIVREVLEANTSLAAARHLELVHDVNAAGPILIDYNRIIQVLSNLIGNSLKFTPGGGTIRVGTEAMDDGVRFFVADTGPGIADEDLENLFRPFWQGRGKVGEGAGLGLSIARGIVEAHGGRIWAQSAPGEGTTMYFTIPLAEERRRERGKQT